MTEREREIESDRERERERVFRRECFSEDSHKILFYADQSVRF